MEKLTQLNQLDTGQFGVFCGKLSRSNSRANNPEAGAFAVIKNSSAADHPPAEYLSCSAILPGMDNRSMSDVGGTPGGLGEFVLGFIMTCVGGYLISNQVTVTSSYWNFWGGNSFGVTLIPLLFGVAILFFNGRSTIGWILTAAGALFILAGVIANMHIYFQPTSLFNTLVMLILLVGGLGLIAKALTPHHSKESD